MSATCHFAQPHFVKCMLSHGFVRKSKPTLMTNYLDFRLKSDYSFFRCPLHHSLPIAACSINVIMKDKDSGAGKMKVKKVKEEGLAFDDKALKRCFEEGGARNGEILL